MLYLKSKSCFLYLGQGNPKYMCMVGDQRLKSSPTEGDFGSLDDRELDVSQHCPLAAKGVNDTVVCIRHNIGSWVKEGIVLWCPFQLRIFYDSAIHPLNELFELIKWIMNFQEKFTVLYKCLSMPKIYFQKYVKVFYLIEWNFTSFERNIIQQDHTGKTILLLEVLQDTGVVVQEMHCLWQEVKIQSFVFMNKTKYCSSLKMYLLIII